MTAEKTKILFVNDEMRMGGVARVLNTLMAHLPEDQYEIDLFILHKEGRLIDEIPEHVHIYEGSSFFQTVDMSLKELLKERNIPLIRNKLRLLFYMKTGLIKGRILKERNRVLRKRYDVEVAAKEGFCTIFTACGNSRKKINWVLTDYSVCNYSKNHMHLVRTALKQIDLNIADSRQALIAYETVFRVYNGTVIHNLMDVDRILSQMNAPLPVELSSGLNLINIARFHPQKGIDRLIRASAAAKEAGIEHCLYLVGGGELEEEMKQLALSLHADHIHFLGYQTNPYALLHQCDLLVLSSYYEGFATVISESLIAGTPVLTTDVSGCEEQITHPDYGWIVENTQEALNIGLRKALGNPERLGKMKASLGSYHYPNEDILKQFTDILR